MNRVQTKLKSKSGVTLLIAIVFMLFCVVIGGSVLASASMNAGRVKQTAEKDQVYLSQRSAALILEEELLDGGELRLTIRPHGSPSIETKAAETTLRQLACYCAMKNYEAETGFRPDIIHASGANEIPAWWSDGTLSILSDDAETGAVFSIDPEITNEGSPCKVWCKLVCDRSTQKIFVYFGNMVDGVFTETNDDGSEVSKMHVEFSPTISARDDAYVVIWTDDISIEKGGRNG